jgi:hypothetical protein
MGLWTFANAARGMPHVVVLTGGGIPFLRKQVEAGAQSRENTERTVERYQVVGDCYILYAWDNVWRSLQAGF